MKLELSREMVERALVGIYLAFVACLSIMPPINFHCQPVVTCPQDLLCHNMFVGMSSERPLMDFFDEHVCFVPVDPFEQDHVIILFV